MCVSQLEAPESAAQHEVAAGLDRRCRDHAASALSTDVREVALIAASAHARRKVLALFYVLIATLDTEAAASGQGEIPARLLDAGSGWSRHVWCLKFSP
jgi:hypothetical protein